MAKVSPDVGPKAPQIVTLFGATGDLARRKLLPGLFHLVSGGFIPGCRIIGLSLDDLEPTPSVRWRAARSTNSRHARSTRPTGPPSPTSSTMSRSPQAPVRCAPRSIGPMRRSADRRNGCII